MRTIKTLVFLLFILTASKTNAQWNIDFSQLQMYKINIQGIINEEQSFYITRLINECNNVLIVKIDKEGEGILFAEGEIDFNEIFQKIQNIPNIVLGERYKTAASKDEFLRVYEEARMYPETDYSKPLPPPTHIKDQQKLSRIQSVYKKLWVEKYPEKYNAMFPAETDKSEAEQAEKRIKVSN